MEIPKHTNCINCGGCCGPVVVSKKELAKIKRFVNEMDLSERNRLKNQNHDELTCQFRDDKLKRCAIYPVRPLTCKLFGVTKGMSCDNGNSSEIDGRKLITAEERKIMPYIL